MVPLETSMTHPGRAVLACAIWKNPGSGMPDPWRPSGKFTVWTASKSL